MYRWVRDFSFDEHSDENMIEAHVPVGDWADKAKTQQEEGANLLRYGFDFARISPERERLLKALEKLR